MADDDLLLDAGDLADIFGADESAEDSSADLAKSIEDLFFSDDDDAAEPAESMTAVLEKEVPVPTATVVEEEPELVEPDQGARSEEEWRGSSEYQEFKKQVIGRHLKKKALEELKRKAEAAAPIAPQAPVAALDDSAKAGDEAERRKQELLDKYKAAKTAAIAQRVQAIVQEQDNVNSASASAEQDKEARFKNYLQELKGKMAAGGAAPQMALNASRLAPQLSDAHKGLDLDVVKCKALASMFEETRMEMLKHVSDAIGKKPAQAMMKKTLAKLAKAHLDVLARAAVDAKNELRVDGTLDEERLSRAIYALPEASRLAKAQKAMYELNEMRFIAIELGLGTRQKAVIVSKTLDGLEKTFAKKAYPASLAKWYMDDVIPSSNLADSDEPGY